MNDWVRLSVDCRLTFQLLWLKREVVWESRRSRRQMKSKDDDVEIRSRILNRVHPFDNATSWSRSREFFSEETLMTSFFLPNHHAWARSSISNPVLLGFRRVWRYERRVRWGEYCIKRPSFCRTSAAASPLCFAVSSYPPSWTTDHLSLYRSQALETVEGLEAVPDLLARAEALRYLWEPAESELKYGLHDAMETVLSIPITL